VTAKAIRALFHAGQPVTVTNHYITRSDHPCFGTQARTVAKVSGSHLWFTESGHVKWPKASQMAYNNGVVQLFGGGVGQDSQALFLSIAIG
jgi:hypothetical protein